MIAYFGKDEHGYFVDHETGFRERLDEDTWKLYIKAASVPAPRVGESPAKLRLIAQVQVDKYDGEPLPENLVATIVGQPEEL